MSIGQSIALELLCRIDDTNRYPNPTTLAICQIACNEIGVLLQSSVISRGIHASQDQLPEKWNVFDP
jgi:hypothetical protein